MRRAKEARLTLKSNCCVLGKIGPISIIDVASVGVAAAKIDPAGIACPAVSKKAF
jgi:hypothetical protein